MTAWVGEDSGRIQTIDGCATNRGRDPLGQLIAGQFSCERNHDGIGRQFDRDIGSIQHERHRCAIELSKCNRAAVGWRAADPDHAELPRRDLGRSAFRQVQEDQIADQERSQAQRRSDDRIEDRITDRVKLGQSTNIDNLIDRIERAIVIELEPHGSVPVADGERVTINNSAWAGHDGRYRQRDRACRR